MVEVDVATSASVRAATSSYRVEGAGQGLVVGEPEASSQRGVVAVLGRGHRLRPLHTKSTQPDSVRGDVLDQPAEA